MVSGSKVTHIGMNGEVLEVVEEEERKKDTERN
jgi:hypothetical protein